MENKNNPIHLTDELLESIGIAMGNTDFDMSWYIDIRESEVVCVSDCVDEELVEEVENGVGGERFISIPSKSSHEGWEQMERFIFSLDDVSEKKRDSLFRAMEGSGAFGRFKDAVHRMGLQDRWYEFRDREDRREALEWLFSKKLIEERDLEKGMQLYEETLARRRKYAEDIVKMTKGFWVKCTYNNGHEEKLTPKKMYEILDERKENLLIRIRDDRGRECWIPKSHFELVSLRKA